MNRRTFLGGLLASVSVPALMVPQPENPALTSVTRTFDYDPAYHPVYAASEPLLVNRLIGRVDGDGWLRFSLPPDVQARLHANQLAYFGPAA